MVEVYVFTSIMLEPSNIQPHKEEQVVLPKRILLFDRKALSISPKALSIFRKALLNFQKVPLIWCFLYIRWK